MQVDVEMMYLAASPPLFSPLMGSPLDAVTSRSSSSSSSSLNNNRHYRSSFQQQQHQRFNTLDFDLSEFASMTLSPALLRTAAETTGLLGRRRTSPPNSSCSQQAANHFNNRSSSLSLSMTTAAPSMMMMTTAPTQQPLRSCLVIRPEEDNGSSLLEPPSSPLSTATNENVDSSSLPVSLNSSQNNNNGHHHQKKKKVVFADAKGFSLTQVKMMTEPSDCPPRWTAEFLEQVTGGASADVASDRWELTFAQPACDYLDFRSRLDAQNVSLENAMVDEADGGHLVGTVKVKNLSFAKTVTLRITFDNWASQADHDATFSSPGTIQGAGQQTAINLFDTFSFRIPVPAIVPSNRIQFCIRFKCDAGEYWDNNLGKNYVIVRPILIKKQQLNLETGNNRQSLNSSRTYRSRGGGLGSNGFKYNDLLSPGSKVDLWADFASWNHLVNDSPYW